MKLPLTPPIGDELVLRPSKKKFAFLLFVSLVFVAIGIATATRDGGVAPWFCAGFFGLCAAAFVVQLLPGASYLRLTRTDFQWCSLFRLGPRVAWTEVSEFRVVSVPPPGTKMVVFDWDGAPSPRLAKWNRRLVGAGAGLPDSYGRKPVELAHSMNYWRLRRLAELSGQPQ